MSISLTPIALVSGQIIPIPLTTPNTTKALVLTNKSVFDCQVIGASHPAGSEWLASGVENMYFPKKQFQGVLEVMVIDNRAPGSLTPSSATLLVTQYFMYEELPPGTYPASVPVQGEKIVADRIINDGNPANTQIIEATVAGDTSSAVTLTNDAIMQLGDAAHHGRLTVGDPANPSLDVFPDVGSGNDVILSKAGKTAQVKGQLDVVQNLVCESQIFMHNNSPINFAVGLIRRISFFTASLTTTSSLFAHGLGVVPDVVLGVNDGTNSTVNNFKYNKSGSDSNNAKLVAAANGTFYLVALQLT